MLFVFFDLQILTLLIDDFTQLGERKLYFVTRIMIS
ncbi:MAG: hypothetical protein ACI9YH_003857 [Colwellia sp.]|jgi:hypothetical protein